MPLYIEDAMDRLIGDRNIRLQMKADDVKKLRSLREAAIVKINGLTEKQRSLILSIVCRYLALLKLGGFPVDKIIGPDGPTWRTALAPPISSSWRIRLDNNQFHVSFPYNSQLISRLHCLTNSPLNNTTARWDGAQWLINSDFQGRNLIRALLNRYDSWQCDTEVTQLLRNTDQHTSPKIRYLNGEWLIDTESTSLREAFNEKINPSNSELVTTFELGSLLVDFDYTVRNRLRSWITPTQIQWLCDLDPCLSANQLPELMTLINTIDRWPILVVGSHWIGPQIVEAFQNAKINNIAEMFVDTTALKSEEFSNLLTTAIANNSHEIFYQFVNSSTSFQRLRKIHVPWILEFPGNIESYNSSLEQVIPTFITNRKIQVKSHEMHNSSR